MYSISLNAQQNEISFYNPLVEVAIRKHLAIDETEILIQDQLDTITTLDLSYKGIEDIRDLLRLPALVDLDLSYNRLSDIGCLIHLANLQNLNLYHNELESADMLTFSQANHIVVDLGGNYIKDFSAFLEPSNCTFTVIDSRSQRTKYEIVFSTNSLIAYQNGDEVTLNCSLYASEDVNAEISIENLNENFSTEDGVMNFTFKNVPLTITPVVLKAGEYSDTTYIVPHRGIIADGSETIVFKLPLPETYDISSINCNVGSVSADGLTLEYVPSTPFTEDLIEIGFSKSSDLRGYTAIRLLNAIPGDVNIDGKVDLADVSALVEHIYGKTPYSFSVDIADINGDGHISVADITALVVLIRNSEK